MLDNEPSVDEVLESCMVYQMDDNGNLIKSEKQLKGCDENKWQIDASRLIQDESMVENFIANLNTNTDKIFGLRINGSKLDLPSANRLCECLWKIGSLPNLVDSDYAYMRMSFASVALMATKLNPASKGGYCSIKRLILTRMDLGFKSTEQIFAALVGNIFLEELVLNGNSCTDAAIPALAKTLKGHQNRFRLLGLGDNELTVESMNILAPVLAAHPYLQELELQGNPLGDDGTDVLFKALRDNNTIESLNLRNCGLKDVPWAGRLRIMTSLSNLDLSQNQINDKGCQVLAGALEGCYCLRYLDLGHNLFGGRLCRGLGEAIKLNRGLLQLSLSSNPMIFEVWNAICYGLMENRTLMRLDCTWCDLSFDSAEKLIEALSVNDVCDVLLDLNPLPDIMRMTPRLYCRPGLPGAVPICEKAAGISLEAGQAWRKEKIRDILNSKRALGFLKSSAAAGENEDDDSVAEQSIATNGVSVTASVNVSPGAKNAKDLAREREIADELATSGFGGKMVLSVAYGRASENLGTIEVNHFTTYAMAKDLIRPLVEAYLASLGTLTLAGKLLDGFEVLDPEGKCVQGNELAVRTVWEEASVNNYTLLLRPGNWIALTEGEQGDDDGDDEFGELEGGSEGLVNVPEGSGPWYLPLISKESN